MAKYADGCSYEGDVKPANQLEVFDGSRIFAWTERGLSRGERAVELVACYTDKSWTTNMRDSEKSSYIQQGAEIVHGMFEVPYNAYMQGTKDIQDFIQQRLLPELKNRAPLKDAVVSENSVVDTRLRQAQVNFFPFHRFSSNCRASADSTSGGNALRCATVCRSVRSERT